jgi:hypothetical protein
MASRFAVELSKKLTADIPEHVVQWGQGVIDKELAEVHEVLDLLQNLPYQNPPCFCRVKWTDGEHDGPCQRAAALYEKLKV